MAWAKLSDDHFRKHLSLSKDAKLLDLAALAACSAQGTDGFVSSRLLRVVAAEVDVDAAAGGVDELVAAGMWESSGDGWRICRYLIENPSAEKVRRDRRAAQERMAATRSAERVSESESDSAPERSAERANEQHPEILPPRPRPRTRTVPGVLKNTSSRRSPLVERAIGIWNAEKHSAQPAIRQCPAGLARQVKEFLAEQGDDLEAFRRAVRAFASDPFMNGRDDRATKPRGLDTMVRKVNRDKWLIEGQADAAPPPPAVLSVRSFEEEQEHQRRYFEAHLMPREQRAAAL